MTTDRHCVRCRGAKQVRRAVDASASGFTLIEIMVVVVILGILGAIAAPSWLFLLTSHTLNSGQDQVFQAMRQAQSEAQHRRIVQQTSFREANGKVQWAIHSPNQVPTSDAWHSLPDGLRIDPQETTLAGTGGLYRVQFNYEGNTNGQLGRLTLMHQNGGSARRCVVASTLLGLVRKGSNHTTPDQSGKFCY